MNTVSLRIFSLTIISVWVLLFQISYPLSAQDAGQSNSLQGKTIKVKLDVTWGVHGERRFSAPDNRITSNSTRTGFREERARIDGQARIITSFIEMPMYVGGPDTWKQYAQVPMGLSPVGQFTYGIDGSHHYKWQHQETVQIMGDYIHHPNKYGQRNTLITRDSNDHCTANEVFQGGQYAARPMMANMPNSQWVQEMKWLDQSGPLSLSLIPKPNGDQQYKILLRFTGHCSGQEAYQTAAARGTKDGEWVSTWGRERKMTIRIEGVIPQGQKSVRITEDDIKENGFPFGYLLHKNRLDYKNLDLVNLSGGLTLTDGEPLGRFERIEIDKCDRACPSVYCFRQGYDIGVDFGKGSLDIEVKLKTRAVDAAPFNDVTSSRTEDGAIDVSVSDAVVEEPVTPDMIERLQDLWEGEIIEGWNDQFELSRADGQGEPLDINFSVDFVEAGYHHEINVLPGRGRSNTRDWYAFDRDYAAHEYGHYLGLEDEYEDHKCASRPQAGEANIMSDVSASPKARHLAHVAEWVSNVTGQRWVVRQNR